MAKTAKDTEQFNIRLPKALIRDIDFIAKHSNVNRNEWIRSEIAEDVTYEKQRITDNIGAKYTCGMLSDKEYQQLIGTLPTEGMKELKERLFNERRDMAKNLKEDSKGIYLDKHMKSVVKKINNRRK